MVTAAGATMREDHLLAAVLDVAHVYGWRCAHFRPALTGRGWRTAVSGDGEGFPDLLCVHPTYGMLAVELKSLTGRLTPAQEAWLTRLKEAGCPAVVWRPRDFLDGTVESVLRQGPVR
jgi:VRR-NUC domain